MTNPLPPHAPDCKSLRCVFIFAAIHTHEDGISSEDIPEQPCDADKDAWIHNTHKFQPGPCTCGLSDLIISNIDKFMGLITEATQREG